MVINNLLIGFDLKDNQKNYYQVIFLYCWKYVKDKSHFGVKRMMSKVIFFWVMMQEQSCTLIDMRKAGIDRIVGRCNGKF